MIKFINYKYLFVRILKLSFSLVFSFIFLLISLNFVQAEIVSKKTKGFEYYLLVPPDYNSSKSWPLIIAFHPSTGRGSSMLDRFTESAEKKGYIVAGPNSANSAYWYFSESKDVFRMIDEIKRDYSIDNSRIYLTGFSAGAIMTYYLGLKFPEKFRAIAPFSGRLRNMEQEGFIRLSRDKKQQLPVFILHGKTDNILNISEAVYAKERLASFGYDVKLRELSGLGHEYPAYINWIIINWFEKLK
ncbi:MAG: dienelactone hydrolase family protein [Candidatus Omnitrophica bacterium]|nr:dienelactone hydrolase family protein [Candidatus Omnitrophota bacterium]